MFKLFQDNEYFRLCLFIFLGFFIVTLGGCGDKLSFGFPTVYYSNEDGLFENPVNLVINTIFMCLIFLLVERVKNRYVRKDYVSIFYKSLFAVVIYIILVSFEFILNANYVINGFWFSFPLVYSFSFFINIEIINIFFNAVANIRFFKYFYPGDGDFVSRFYLILFSILFLFVIFNLLKLYYKIKENPVRK